MSTSCCETNNPTKKKDDTDTTKKPHTHSSTCCQPVESKVFNFKKDLLFAILSGLFLLLGFLIEKLTSSPKWIFLLNYGISYAFGSYYTIAHAWKNLLNKKFDIDFLMLVAAIGAASLGNYAEGGLLLFLFSLAHSMEHHALNKARSSIAALSELTPDRALLKIRGQWKEVPIENLKIGDVILVKPNTKIAADGVVIQGESSVNQSPITGESVPVDKSPMPAPVGENFDHIYNSHKVYAGSINGHSALEIMVLRLAKDSTLSRLAVLVEEGEAQRSPAQRFAQKFSAIFVPSVLVLVFLLLFVFLVRDESFKDSFYRAMAVLVASSPCALAISTPSAVLSGIARAAKGGVLVKGGLPLYEMAHVNALAFDKTGTLTTGEPKLTLVQTYGDTTDDELLGLVVAVESLSDHPIAKAIARDGRERLKNYPIPNATNLVALTARGVSASVNQEDIHIGNQRLAEEILNDSLPATLKNDFNHIEKKGHTAMLVLRQKNIIGIIAVQDTPRPEASESISQLKKIGFEKIVMLTGDNTYVAHAVAEKVGIPQAYGSLLPEDKVAAIKKLKETHRIAMVGDGVNDAPAMAYSNIGISMGAAGSDVALETSHAALLGDSIHRLPFAFLLARKTNLITKQNLGISIGVMAILVPLTILGLTIGPAVVIHEGSTLLVVANALRLFRFKTS